MSNFCKKHPLLCADCAIGQYNAGYNDALRRVKEAIKNNLSRSGDLNIPDFERELFGDDKEVL